MINLHQAWELLAIHAPKWGHEEIAVQASLGRFLAEDIFAPMDLPPFDNSSVDGFAVRMADLIDNHTLKINESIRAVGQDEPRLRDQSCAAIMTGAPIPAGCDAVVMKEQVKRQENTAIFSAKPEPGQHIRKKGGDVKTGLMIAAKGSSVTPALMGLFLGLGLVRVKVFQVPKIVIICTGDELVNPPEPLRYGQVYFFLGAMLKAQCAAFGFHDVAIIQVGDNQNLIEATINNNLHADIILLTGGISQGDHDLVRPALARCNVTQIFWQGYWRPAKPLYFGAKDNTRIFGLPGNPVAAFVGFHIFVQRMLGQSYGNDLMPTKSARLLNDFQKAPGWTLFPRAKVDPNNHLTILAHQDSHQIFSLAQSNALCLLDASTTVLKAGDVVNYYPI
jgi:molybdopterin molybdotransferase